MIAIAALLLAAAHQPAPTPDWLSGLWVPVSDSAREDEAACAGGDTQVWYPGGRFEDGGGAGRWRLSGGRLAETASEGDGPYLGATRVSRVVRLGPDRLRLTDAEGDQSILARCRR